MSKSSGKSAAEKNEEYLQRLEHKNRLKKNLSIKNSSEKQAEDRERGFSTHFAGANASENKRTARVKHPTIVNAPSTTTVNVLKVIAGGPQSDHRKKGWDITPQKSRPVFQAPAVSPLTIACTGTEPKSSVWENGRSQQIEKKETEDNLNLKEIEDDEYDNEYMDDDFEEDFEVDGVDEESTNEIEGRKFIFNQGNCIPNLDMLRREGSCGGDEDEDFQDSIDLSARKDGIVTHSANCQRPTAAVDQPPPQNNELSHQSSGFHYPTAHSKCASASPIKMGNLNVDVKSNNEDDVAVLASRLKALHPKKQEELMALLNEMEGGYTGSGRGLAYSHSLPTSSENLKPAMFDTGSQGVVATSPDKTKKSTLPDKKESLSAATTIQELQTIQEPRRALTVRLAASNSSTHTSNLSLRIIAHNGWVKTTYASLSAMRLCVRGCNTEIPLNEFKAQITTGNDVLPKSAQVARSVSNLFNRSRVSKKVDWIFPISRNSCVQLELSGTIEDAIALEDLELLVWNGCCDVNKSTSAVMDMDIYCGKKCIWTGSLEKGDINGGSVQLSSQKLNPSASNFDNIRYLVDHVGFGRRPSVTVPLAPSKQESFCDLNDSQKATISNQISSKVSFSKISSLNCEGNVGKDVPSLFFTGMSTASSIGEHMKLISTLPPESHDVRSPQDCNEPTWFSDLKTPRMEFDESGERDNDLLTMPGHSQQIASKRDDRRNGSAKASARRLSKEVSRTENIISDPELPVKQKYTGTDSLVSVPVAGFPMKSLGPRRGGRRRPSKEDEHAEEVSLRNSLEAMNKSDRRNRGRIENKLQSSLEIDRDQVVCGEEKAPIINDERHLFCLNEVSGGVLNSEIEKQNALKNRSNRIDEVQVTVSSALQDLATVMSTLTSSGKHPSHTLTQSSTHSPVQGIGLNDNSDVLSSLNKEVMAPICPQDSFENIPPDLDSKQGELESDISYDIPVLPSGQVLQFDILSTWGDPYYVGLNGIDIFDINGDVLTLENGVRRITSEPCDINDLPEYDNDPRTVSNLLDESNFTRDDLHVWLAPHGHTIIPPLAAVATIKIEFTVAVSLSLVRVWNYNKSRTHCYRGVRRARVKLDKKIVFEGEIRMSPGLVASSDECSEIILFSTNNSVLERISLYDIEMGYRSNDDEATTAWVAALNQRLSKFRPRTSDCLSSESLDTTLPPSSTLSFQHDISRPFTAVVEDGVDDKIVDNNVAKETSLKVSSPTTRVTTHVPNSELKRTEEDSFAKSDVASLSPHSLSIASNTDSMVQTFLDDCDLVACRVLTLVLESTWGDKCYIGLCGVEVTLGCNSIVAELSPAAVDASPRDLSVIGVFDDPRVPENLVNGVNDTTDDQYMWLIPYTPGGKHELRIDLGSMCKLSGISIWNYNKSSDDALRGARAVAVLSDGVLIGKMELRIAPGCDGVAYRQHCCFRDIKSNEMRQKMETLRYVAPSLRQDYETPCNVSGMLWKIGVYSNWGDGYYVGLDGFEFFDGDGHVLNILEMGSITCSPHMWDLDIGKGDPREPRNLGLPNKGGASWLAPLSQSITRAEQLSSVSRLQPKKYYKESTVDHDPFFYDHNVLFILFDKPVSVSVIRFHNYSKSPKRGVKDFGIEVDHRVVYMGRMQRIDSCSSVFESEGQSVVFSRNPTLTRREKQRVSYCGSNDQDVLCINDRKVIIRSKNMYETPSVSSEGIYADLSKRPTTAAISKE